MDSFDQRASRAADDVDTTLVLSLEQKQRLCRRRSAWLHGLIVPQQSAEVSPGLAEVIEHREREQARQTRDLASLVGEALAHEQTQRPQAPLPEAPGEPPPASAAQPSRWTQLFTRLRPRRVPVLLQLSAVECGAACLAMMLSYYGRRTSVADVRQRCQVGRDQSRCLLCARAVQEVLGRPLLLCPW